MTETRASFPLTESLRGLAACTIVAFHVATTCGITDSPGPLRQVVGRFDVSLWIFFLISGFLLYRPFAVAGISGRPRPSLIRYGWRRLLRIAPGYWVALTVTAVVLGWPDVFTASTAPRLFLLIQNYWNHSYTAGLGPGWSLSVEVAFYAMLPLYVLAMSRVRVRGGRRVALEVVLLAALTAGSIWFKWFAMFHFQNANRLLPWWLDLLTIGMLLAVVSAGIAEQGWRPRLLRLVDRRPGVPVALAAGLFALFAFGLGFTGDWRQPYTVGQVMERHLLSAVIALLIVVPAVFGDPTRGLTRRLAGARPLRFLGRISYGIYLYQVLGLVFMVRMTSRDLGLPGL